MLAVKSAAITAYETSNHCKVYQVFFFSCKKATEVFEGSVAFLGSVAGSDEKIIIKLSVVIVLWCPENCKNNLAGMEELNRKMFF